MSRSAEAPVLGPRLSAAGGVAITGIDLARPLTDALRDLVLAAIRHHHIVVFPGQALTREQQYRFTAAFGDVERHGGAQATAKRLEVAHVTANLDEDGASERAFRGRRQLTAGTPTSPITARRRA